MDYTHVKYAQIFENYDNTDMKPSEPIDDIGLEAVKFKYSWTINSSIVDILNGPVKELLSPKFPNGANSGLIWYLKIYPVANLLLGVQLILSSCNNIKEVSANFKFKVLGSHKEVFKIWSNTFYNLFKENEPLNTCQAYYATPVNPRCDIPQCPDLACHRVTIKCEIVVPASQVYPTMYPINRRNLTNPTFQFATEFQSMFENEELSDVTFSINGRELQAHKVILAAGSSVFKAMFEHEMMEKKHNRVEIIDIEFEVFRELLRFIYTEKVSNFEQMAKELLVAADKYELEKLKNKCESVLCKNLSHGNISEMFIFADTYNSDLLKDLAKRYIVAHPKDVSCTDGWQSMIVTHPHLLAEAFLALANI